jgi:hypothetical protein
LFLPSVQAIITTISSNNGPKPAVPSQCAQAFARTALDANLLTPLVLDGVVKCVTDLTVNSRSLTACRHAPHPPLPPSPSPPAGLTMLPCTRCFPVAPTPASFIPQFLNQILEVPSPIAPLSATSIDVQLPVTCTVDSVNGGEGCLGQILEPITNTTVTFALDTCPNTTFPYVSVGCMGGLCDASLFRYVAPAMEDSSVESGVLVTSSSGRLHPCKPRAV